MQESQDIAEIECVLENFVAGFVIKLNWGYCKYCLKYLNSLPVPVCFPAILLLVSSFSSFSQLNIRAGTVFWFSECIGMKALEQWV